MKLEINTNGAWKTILYGIGAHNPEQYRLAMTAAAELAAADAMTDTPRRPSSWRLVDEETGDVVSYCAGATGWTGRVV